MVWRTRETHIASGRASGPDADIEEQVATGGVSLPAEFLADEVGERQSSAEGQAAVVAATERGGRGARADREEAGDVAPALVEDVPVGIDSQAAGPDSRAEQDGRSPWKGGSVIGPSSGLGR